LPGKAGDELSVLINIILFFNGLVLAYFILVNGTYLVLNVIAYRTLRRYDFIRAVTDYDQPFYSTFYKPISIIVPAYNEEMTIIDTVKSILFLRYPEFEVLVVNDGSEDETLEVLKQAFSLEESEETYDNEIPCGEIRAVYHSFAYPNLKVVDKENGGKGDALNAGINVSTFPLFCNIDADSLIDAWSLLQIVKPFVEDHRVQAAGGVIRVANDCEIQSGEVREVRLSHSWLVRFQIVEYLRAFLFGRVGWSSLQTLMIISGAFGVFRRRAAVRAGGYRTDTVGEDMELVLRLHRTMRREDKDYRVVFYADPVCWTQVPDNFRGLSRQRRRWQRGLGESLMKNWQMTLNPRYGSVGLLGFPFFILFELFSPIIEFCGYIVFILALILGIINTPFVIAFLVAAILLGILLSVSSIFLEEISFHKYPTLRDVMILCFFAVLENFGYRQLTVWWRLRGMVEIVFHRRDWGKAERRRFDEGEDTVASEESTGSDA
jgi:cellulose synthase/poly-beta-1,6-N-acetylglucosamine synthase-like glycosyltransferase